MKIPKLFGDANERELKKLRPLVDEINELESEFQQMSDQQLREATAEFKQRLGDGEDLDDLLPEAFANVREAAKRTLKQRHFDVQLIGGMILHQGKIAEMRTGEGKTLVATLPVYLNALEGAGVHVVTVNDYLARRDTQWMGPIYHHLGLSIGCLQHDSAYLFDPNAETDDEQLANLRPVPRRQAYEAHITYGTNSEFGFDYLRDNMVLDLSQTVQRPLNYCIVDEVDNILIDEARTPLIISGRSNESAQNYANFAQIIPTLHEEADYTIDEKTRSASLTQSGIEKIERRLNIQNLYDPANYNLTHYVDNALKSHAIYRRDREYVVKDGEVIIVDEFTGRLMPGRRYSDGLHQAIEAKEGVKVRAETVTLGTITLQNYFRLYLELAGMTGTAATEAEELYKIYKTEVLVIPTHKEMIREDHHDFIYKTEAAKYEAIAKEIKELHKEQRPVLIGTVSIEKSEQLAGLLTRRGVPHQVLNAKQHEREAGIVAQAGRLGGVTVATNMAGRGVDIVLGGVQGGREPKDWQREHDRVIELGGLRIIGSERHEARRIDNQLRGRAGRQGDPGSSRFYVSLEDDLMRRFGGDTAKKVMDWAGLPDDVPIESGFVSKIIESSQTRVEGYNFDIRKHLLDYDDVVNKHREIIYGERNKILRGADLKANIQDMVQQEIEAIVAAHLAAEDVESWDLEGLFTALKSIFPLPANLTEDALTQLSREEAQEALLQYSDRLYAQREQEVGPDNMRILERMVMLRTIDSHWIEHLTAMEGLRQGIGLQGVGQRDPLVAYKSEGHTMFGELNERIRHDIVRTIYRVAVRQEGEARPQPVRQALAPSKEQKQMAAAVGNRELVSVATKVGRNEPCPCGSGKKYKRCHGA
ncbi:MAG: preprotein translocase subunit SecA [Dehalococcoidia bacterium]